MVLGQHPPQLGQPERLDLLQLLGAALLLGIRHVRPDVRRIGQAFLVSGHLLQPIGRQPDLGHGLAGLDRSERQSRVVGQIGDDRIVDAGRGGPLAGDPLEWQRGRADQRRRRTARRSRPEHGLAISVLGRVRYSCARTTSLPSRSSNWRT